MPGDNNGNGSKKIGPTMVLQRFFGYREGSNLAGFSAELKDLTTDERCMLAIGAARELGLSQDEVSFDLATGR
jgi:hypothetical protein